MSKNKKKKQGHSIPHRGKVLFGEKENAILREEMADETAPKRNTPILLNLLQEYAPQCRMNPFDILEMLDNHHRSMMAHASMSGQTVDDDRIINTIVQQLSEQINLESILDIYTSLAKNAKIKREKRALLWAIADTISTVSSRQKLHESPAIRTFILSSIWYAMTLGQKISAFLFEQEPFSFSYKKILNGSFSYDDWKKLIDEISPSDKDFLITMSHHARVLFQEVSRPFGFRFCQIIRYPRVMKDKLKRSILLPGEADTQPDDKLDEETAKRLIEALMLDISHLIRLEYAQNVLQSIRSAAFGEMEERELNICLNAAAFCLISPLPINPFLIELYRRSGEKAEEINPSDEREIIIDLKGSPDNIRLYHKYAELLENKNEYLGAAQVYSYIRTLQKQDDPQFEEKLKTLISKFLESEKYSLIVSNESNPADPQGQENQPVSNSIVTP